MGWREKCVRHTSETVGMLGNGKKTNKAKGPYVIVGSEGKRASSCWKKFSKKGNNDTQVGKLIQSLSRSE